MKAAHENFKLSDEVAEFIAENATTNIREMEGLLNKIIFFSSLANRVIDTKELAYDALQDFIDEKRKPWTRKTSYPPFADISTSPPRISFPRKRRKTSSSRE